MPYSALPAARRRHYEIDGTVVGWNATATVNGLVNLPSNATVLALNEESPTVDGSQINVGNSLSFFYFLFPELIDLSFILLRFFATGGGGGNVFLDSLETSTNTTTGVDGTWNTLGTSVSALFRNGSGDWWRANSPATCTSNNNGINAVRFALHQTSTSNAYGPESLYFWGTKHSGQTPDDIIFLESDGTTEWPNDDDWGDINAGSAAVTHTYYVKNTSATKTANTITVKSSGSDNGKWGVSLDNVSFASSKSISSLAAGATQVVYFRFTPPAAAAGVYRPNAAYLEADVTFWT